MPSMSDIPALPEGELAGLAVRRVGLYLTRNPTGGLESAVRKVKTGLLVRWYEMRDTESFAFRVYPDGVEYTASFRDGTVKLV